MPRFNWAALVGPLINAAITIAEAAHPGEGAGQTKLATAFTIAQTGIGVAAAAGLIPPSIATNSTAIIDAINTRVAAANQAGGVVVPKI